MSKTTAALEAAVAIVIENTPSGDVRQTARQRANADRAFASILKLIAPRIRHFIRQYGLVAHWDDAEQCCAIGVHRAIQAYQPEKAQFTTFVNWQLRGELQSLRFRLMTDQRPSAKKVEATTVSLHSTALGADGEETTLESVIVDEDALELTETGASDFMTGLTRAALIDRYVQHLRQVGIEQLKRRARGRVAPIQPGMPRLKSGTHNILPEELAELEQEIAQHCAMVEQRLFDDVSLEELEAEAGLTKERVRQITKRAAKTMAELAGGEIAATVKAKSIPARPRAKAAAPATLLPAVDAAHNQFARVVEPELDMEERAEIVGLVGGIVAAPLSVH